MKYSGTKVFEVELTGTANEVQLTVRDQGAGFNVQEAMANCGGLGLLSMQERVHLVHGKFAIESQPGSGTRIIAVVPFLTATSVSPVEAEKDPAETASGVA